MPDPSAFIGGVITDTDEDWATEILGLPPNAFRGSGSDPRTEFFRLLDTVDVSACPGSGKTTLLVAKLAVLAQKWTAGTQGICVLSHTNAAREEIEHKLANSSVGQKLLSYPHFVGTIHRFVDTFMAVPWLRSQGYAVKLIDSDRCQALRSGKLPFGAQAFLARRGEDMSSYRVLDADFNIGRYDGGKMPCGPHTTTYKAMQAACRALAAEGYHCYEDAFVWAHDLLEKHPEVVAVLRDRFPLVFIDEAQDNSEEQSCLLYRVFCEGFSPSVRQRLGDPNQAIYDFFGQSGASTDPFPADSSLDLPRSHRFGKDIAHLADPLGLSPYDMIGDGPRQPVDGYRGSNALILFDDNTIGDVLPCFGQLLIDSFPEEVLKGGTFTAIGQVHRRPANADASKVPQYVGDYWADYDAELTPKRATRDRFLQYVAAGVQVATSTGEAHHAVRATAEGLLRLAALMGLSHPLPSASSPHRTVLRALPEDNRTAYLAFIERHIINLEGINEEGWETELKSLVLKWGQLVSGSQANESALQFLHWTPGVGGVEEEGQRRANIFAYPPEDPKVRIRVGSIHSVKGETHDATLVLETHWHDHNLGSITKWLDGTKSGSSGQPRRDARLKTHYVAMTRPSHMLCVAMRAASFQENGSVDQQVLAALESHGWKIVQLQSAEDEH